MKVYKSNQKVQRLIGETRQSIILTRVPNSYKTYRMKIQSELIGNYEKYGIKSLYDNTFGETNRNIDAVRAENYKNTCEITNAIHAEGEATRALMTQNTIQELRDELQAAQLQLGNLSQTANIIGTLRPYPQPAYITCSPYQASNVYGCGFNAFNGCGNC